MDIGAAFTFVFDDEDWVKKLAIGGGIILLAIPLSLVLVGLLLLLPIHGYKLQVIKSVRDDVPESLPQWGDFGTLIKIGLFVVLIWIIYHLPALLFIFGAVSIQAMLVIGFFPNIDGNVLGTVSTCFYVTYTILSIIGSIIFPAGLLRFADTDELRSALQFGEVFSFIRDNIGDYVIVIAVSLAASMLAVFGFFLCGVGIVFTYFWSILVNANLYGQLARKAQGAA